TVDNCIDWGEAPDVSLFYGRTEELATLQDWIVNDRCRLVTLLSLGGMGKTCLSVKLTQHIQHHFEFVIWRSLLPALPLKDLLAELIAFLSNGQDTDLPESIHHRISRLIRYLQLHRCLLVLDQAETVVKSCAGRVTTCSDQAECGCKNYQEYSQFFHRIGESPHQSCLVLTSREQPKEIALLEGESLPVRVLPLKGLQLQDIQQILKRKGHFQGSTAHWHQLIDGYAGNPLVLKMVARTIQKVFAGSIPDFLHQNTFVFGDCLNLLEQHFNRLSDTEKEMIKWLALNREPASFSELQTQISPPMSPPTLLEVLDSLEARCLVTKVIGIKQRFDRFSLQPIVMEYVADRLLKEIMTQVTFQALPSEYYPNLAG
ncbi:MAG TPA: NB-ARC domain-containing protein, partial [Stenomitos sp.]